MELLNHWEFVSTEGAAQELLRFVPPPDLDRLVQFCEPSSPSLVLGSSQHLDQSVADWAARKGYALSRRHSGGGAVAVAPGAQLWVNIYIRRSDPLFVHDISKSFHWIGEVFQSLCEAAGASSPRVQSSAPILSPLSKIICFAGVGAGEITVDGRKIVGFSQRRTRDYVGYFASLQIRELQEDLVQAFESVLPVARGSSASTLSVTGLRELGSAVELPQLKELFREMLLLRTSSS